MARDRFRKILHHLHPKAQKLVDLANMNFQRYWTPYPHIAIDEGLPYRCHLIKSAGNGQ
jgi:hypothetical protein